MQDGIFHLDSHSRKNRKTRPFSPQCVLQNKGHLKSALGLCKPRIAFAKAAKSLSLDSQADKGHKRKLLGQAAFLFSLAKFLFEQVHAVQKQYFLGSIIHTGFLRFGLRKLLAAGQWGIWQLQRITCIMTRLSKASPRHHSACSQENQKSTCAVEGFFSHSLKPSPERIEITLHGWGNCHIFHGKKYCILWNHLHPWIRPAALAAGTARCHVVTVVCGMPWQSESDPKISKVISSHSVCQRYLQLKNSAPWASQALHYPGVQLQVSFETDRTLPHGNLKKFGDKSRLQFAQGHWFSGGFIEPVLEPIAQMQAQVR